MTVTALAVCLAGCRGQGRTAAESPPSILRIGFGLTTGANAEAGIRQTVLNLALEGLLSRETDGRPQARLAESWTTSPDGLRVRVQLRPDVFFHDGTPVTAASIREVLLAELPGYLGPDFADVKDVLVVSDREIELILNRRSTFAVEGLHVPIEAPGGEGIGTGPFYRVESADGAAAEMRANERYYQGAPLIDRILIESYSSVRSAWADMLRGEVDMLYEVGVDAVDLLRPSRDVQIFSAPRPYALVAVLNVQRPALRDAAVRRALNAAIDRETLVREALQGYGTPAGSPLWPLHWAHDPLAPRFSYAPRALTSSAPQLTFSLLYTEQSHERTALVIQQQLARVGVTVRLEVAPLDQALGRVGQGDFDAFLADAALGPTMIRPYWFWNTGGPFNWGGFSSPAIDAAFDQIRAAADDTAYRAGVSALQYAVVDDPPAIFLVWGERARAVSTRFEVVAEPNRDIFPMTLRLWRPRADTGTDPVN